MAPGDSLGLSVFQPGFSRTQAETQTETQATGKLLIKLNLI